MMKILENDLHRSHKPSAIPFYIEVPARPRFLPAIISSSKGDGKFLVSDKLTGDGRIRVGVFEYDSEKIDKLIPPMIESAFSLSKERGFSNIFNDIKSAFEYIKTNSHMPCQPHVCLIPSSWDEERIIGVFGERNLKKVSGGSDSGLMKYNEYCWIAPIDVKFATFLSKPDMVGLYTNILSGSVALLLHNVKQGMAFFSE